MNKWRLAVLCSSLVLPLPASAAAPAGMEQWLETHNNYRRLHGVPEVTWSETIAASAQAFIDTCPSNHSKSEYGENLAWATYSMPEAAVVEMWYSEEKDYDYNNPQFSYSTGHFTQVVWKGTTEIGCAFKQGCTSDMFEGRTHTAWTCQYNPPGNYDNQFADNVFPPNANPDPDFGLDAGEVRVNHRPARVKFSHRFERPVVVAHMTTKLGSQPAVVRVYNIDNEGFTVRIQEYDYLDGGHAIETINYIVMEEGRYTLPDGTAVEAGRFEVAGNDAFSHQVLKQSFNSTPVIATSVTTINGFQTVVGRVDEVTTTGFNYMLQEQELNTDGHNKEQISYIAWEPGSGKVGSMRYLVAQPKEGVTGKKKSIAFEKPFGAPPLLLANMQTANGDNTAKLAIQSVSNSDIQGFIEEEASLDNETNHTGESIGFIGLTQE